MPTRDKQSYKRGFAVLSLAISLILSTNSHASADLSPDYVQLSWPNVYYVNSDNALSLDITPLADQSSDDDRGISWIWNTGPTGITVGANVGFDNNRNGQPHDGYFNFTGVVGVNSTGAVDQCQKRNPITINGINTFTAACGTNGNFDFEVGHTYHIQISNNASLGPSWFSASIQDTTTKYKYQLASVNVGDANVALPVQRLNVHVYDNVPDTNCGPGNVIDTVFSNYQDGSSLISDPNILNESSCGDAVAIPNRGALGGVVIKFGGLDTGTRNPENAPPLAPATPTLDSNSNTGLTTNLNYTNISSPNINISALDPNSSVSVTATSVTGTQVYCNIIKGLVINNSVGCTLQNLSNGIWAVTATQTVNGQTSLASGVLNLNVDTDPVVLNIESTGKSDRSTQVSIRSNKAGIGYIIPAGSTASTPSQIEALGSQTFVKFAIGTDGSSTIPATTNLLPGSYKVFFEDLAGSSTLDSSAGFTITQAKAPAKTALLSKSISCHKGKVTKIIQGINPTCPTGFTKR